MQQKRSRTRPGFTAAPGRWWKNIAIPTLPVLACFLGGATEKWSEGIVVALLGVILLVDPPQRSLGLALNVVVLGIIAGAATAFLPETWFQSSQWRPIFVHDFGISLPTTLSPQPWISLGCFVSFLAGISWIYYVGTVDLELREVRQQLRFFATGIVFLAVLCIALHSAHTSLPFWHNQRGFGPFPNRNQTANLFGLTAVVILACGQDDIRHGRNRWIAWLVGLAFIVAAVVLDFSRAGIVILVVGSALWLGVFALRTGSMARVALGLSALLILLTVVLVFGGHTFERFHLRTSDAGDIAPDLRWAIYRDTLQLIRASPWCGIGFGNFDGIFPIFRDASLTGAPAIHPESDWFWLWTEVGLPVVILTMAGIAMLVRRVFPLQEGTNQRFRLAALIASVLFVLHGVVDVSGHRVGTAFSGMFLLGMALRRPAQLKSSPWLGRLFRLVGLLLLISGTAWLVATRYDMPLPGAVGVENELHHASSANQGRNFDEAIQHATRAIGWAPLKWQLYFSRGIGKVGAKRPAAEALDDFQRARFLEPNAYEVPYQEGIVWLAREPSLAIVAWQEALRRVGPQRLEIYGHMLALASQHSPAVRRGLEQIGVASHDLALVYLQGAAGGDFISTLHDLLENDPNLEKFSSQERVRLFAFWADRGDPKELARAVEAHPDWMRDAWRPMGQYHANRKDFRLAFQIVQRFEVPPAMPETAVGSSVDQLQQLFHASPGNFGVGYQLYRAQMKASQIDEALATVRHFTERPDCPAYFHFLEAEAWAAKENWERAWNAWKAFEAGEQKRSG